MKDYARIASRLLNTPLAIRPEKAEMFVAVLGERLGIMRLERMDGSVMTATEFNAVSAAGRADAEGSRKYRSFDVVNGIAFIPIEGTLIHKAGYVGTSSGLIGYDGILTQCREAWDDPEVQAIWLDVDSPGGEVAGCFDAVDELYANNKKNGGKPLWAMINEQATSAAFALVSAADKVHITRTGIGASIGVYVLYVDQRAALKEDGLAVEVIRSGERKARGMGIEEPLDDGTRAKLQALVDDNRKLFAATVARNRGMSVKAVMGTEGDWFGAEECLSLGLVDGVMSEVEALAKLQRSLKRAA
jgi:ClpP class serine protease